MRHTVDYLYSLYDALISIHVPADKALATKSDLDLLRSEFRQELALVRKDLELFATGMTVRLGSMLIVGLGVLFAALKLT